MAPGTIRRESTRQLGAMLRDVFARNGSNFRLFCPDETNSNRLNAVFEVENRAFVEPKIAIPKIMVKKLTNDALDYLADNLKLRAEQLKTSQ